MIFAFFGGFTFVWINAYHLTSIMYVSENFMSEHLRHGFIYYYYYYYDNNMIRGLVIVLPTVCSLNLILRSPFFLLGKVTFRGSANTRYCCFAHQRIQVHFDD